MKPRYYRRKVDKNQSQIIRDLVACGFTVIDLSALGGGIPDLLVGGYNLVTKQRENKLVEIKDPNAPKADQRPRDSQLQFNQSWKGGPPTLCKTADEVTALFGMFTNLGR